MSRWALAAAIALMPFISTASTKKIQCEQTDKGIKQVIFATVDDVSDKAEVQLYALSADCAKSQTCEVKIYTKEALPSVIRLIHVVHAGLSASYTTLIDIDRTDLSVVTRTKLELPTGITESVAHGQCTVKTMKSQKLL